MMAHNSPTKPPSDEDKVDWFLNSVIEKNYDSVHAGCTDKQLDGTLTFARVVKLYTNRCFKKYPHFQIDDLTNDKKEFSNNATSFNTPHQGKGKGKYPKGKGRQIGYPGGYCTVPVGTAAVPVLWVLQMDTAGYCGYCRYCAVLTVPKGTAGYCGYCGYCTG